MVSPIAVASAGRAFSQLARPVSGPERPGAGSDGARSPDPAPAPAPASAPDPPPARGGDASRAGARPGLGAGDLAVRKAVAELRATDREVRAHEQAHKAAGGRYAGGASFDFAVGPDGHRYAVGGEVPIDASAVPGDPEATIRKMAVVVAAALAPARPSAQDRAVAAQAAQTALSARAELAAERGQGVEETGDRADPTEPGLSGSPPFPEPPDPGQILDIVA